MQTDWYIWIEPDWENEFENANEESMIPMRAFRVTYAPPPDDVMYIRVKESQKPDYRNQVYYSHSILNKRYYLKNHKDVNKNALYVENGNIEINQNADFIDTYKDIVEFILRKMQEVDDQVGDIWKLPEPYWSLLYSLTESNEVSESIILQVRISDSRNNKKLEDFDTATELFDVLMMLFRFHVALMKEVGIEDNYHNSALWQKFEQQYNNNLLHHNEEMTLSNLNWRVKALYENEPISLIGELVDLCKNYKKANLPEPNTMTKREFVQYQEFDGIYEQIWAIFDYVINHPVITVDSIYRIAGAKFDKILKKSLAKKNSQN